MSEYVVIANKLNLRASPVDDHRGEEAGEQSAILTTLPRTSAELPILDTNKVDEVTYYQVRMFDGKEGWLSALVRDAIASDQTVLVVQARTEQETAIAREVIQTSVGDYRDVNTE